MQESKECARLQKTGIALMDAKSHARFNNQKATGIMLREKLI